MASLSMHVRWNEEEEEEEEAEEERVSCSICKY